MAQRDRGGLQNVHEYAFRKYLGPLADMLRRKKLESPAPTMDELKAQVRVVQYQPQNLAIPAGARGPSYYRKVADRARGVAPVDSLRIDVAGLRVNHQPITEPPDRSLL